jgi:hypothetical protein
MPHVGQAGDTSSSSGSSRVMKWVTAATGRTRRVRRGVAKPRSRRGARANGGNRCIETRRRVPVAGRGKAWTRSAVQSHYGWRCAIAADAELIRVVNSMRQQNEALDDQSARGAYVIFQRRSGGHASATNAGDIDVTPADQLAAFVWLTRMSAVGRRSRRQCSRRGGVKPVDPEERSRGAQNRRTPRSLTSAQFADHIHRPSSAVDVLSPCRSP